MKIADIHAHIFPEKLAEKASHSIGSFYGVSIGREADMPRLCAEDKLAGITRCAVSNSATNASQVQNANTFLAEAVRGHDGYVAFGTIYPGMDGFEEELDRMLALGLRGIKIHPDFQKLAIDDERGIDTYRAIARRNLPVLFHMGDDRYDFSSPERLTNLLRRVPEEKREPLREVLEQDPRPSYQDDPERIYGFGFAGMEVRFRASNGVLTVLDIRKDN